MAAREESTAARKSALLGTAATTSKTVAELCTGCKTGYVSWLYSLGCDVGYVP